MLPRSVHEESTQRKWVMREQTKKQTTKKNQKKKVERMVENRTRNEKKKETAWNIERYRWRKRRLSVCRLGNLEQSWPYHIVEASTGASSAACFFFCLPILLPWILLPAASSLRWGRALINHRLCMLRIIFSLSSTSRRLRGGGVLDSSWHMRRQSIDDVRYSIGRLMNRSLTLRVHLRSAICNDSSATLIAACFSSSY